MRVSPLKVSGSENELALVEEFKGAMRHLASGVSIISAGQGTQRRGLTATAVCSLSMAPPMVLICVNHGGEAHQAISDSAAFCVNVLAESDRALADCFSGQTGVTAESRFQYGSWSGLHTGSPALDSALVNIDCRVAQVVSTATHSVFFGEVAQVRSNVQTLPLIHFNRLYGSLTTQD